MLEIAWIKKHINIDGFIRHRYTLWIFYGVCKLSFVWHFAFRLLQLDLLIPVGDHLLLFLWTNLSPQSCDQKSEKKKKPTVVPSDTSCCLWCSLCTCKIITEGHVADKKEHTTAGKLWSFGGTTHHSIYRSFFLLKMGLWLALTPSCYGALDF